jgi:hypothetical protein
MTPNPGRPQPSCCLSYEVNLKVLHDDMLDLYLKMISYPHNIKTLHTQFQAFASLGHIFKIYFKLSGDKSS